MSFQREQDKRLTRQIETWVNQMIPVTPIGEWGNALARLLVDWANNYGIIFTKESLDAVQHYRRSEGRALMLRWNRSVEIDSRAFSSEPIMLS